MNVDQYGALEPADVTALQGGPGRLLTLAPAPLPRRARTAILGRVVAGMADAPPR